MTDLIFDMYVVMSDSDFDDEDNAPSSSIITQNQDRYEGNDNNLTNKIWDHIMFQMFMNYNGNQN